MLDVTKSVGHALLDGAAAARFARRLADLVKSATASGRQVTCVLRPRLDAAEHPALHQEAANQPERIRQRTGKPGTGLASVPVL